MQFELAPMEGITGYIFRNAYLKYFGDMDRYFTPFIASTGLNHKELNDVLPEHNEGFMRGLEKDMNVKGEGQIRPRLVPQILSNRAEDFLMIADRLRQMGYSHVNLNLGCPSGTVVSRGRGAGFLGVPSRLDAFLEEIYEKCPLSVSVKTRLGVTDMEDWEGLLEIYEKYPMEELIIHPRIQRDFYKHPLRLEGMELALHRQEKTGGRISICYNGEIHSLGEYQTLRQRFPRIQRVMLGRGVLKNPFLTGELRQWEKRRQVSEDYENPAPEARREVLWAFHQEMLNGYREIMAGEQNALYKMKELWTYLGDSFPGKEKALKKIRKAGDMIRYESAVREVFD